MVVEDCAVCLIVRHQSNPLLQLHRREPAKLSAVCPVEAQRFARDGTTVLGALVNKVCGSNHEIIHHGTVPFVHVLEMLKTNSNIRPSR